jgi:hypothetical protein
MDAERRRRDVRVFISWSGELSRALAVILRDWLPLTVQHVHPWTSDRDIRPGDRWALVLGRALEESDFGIICLTPDNLKSQWLLFEAGAMSRARDAKVVPLRFGLDYSDLDDPLAQFQSVGADRTGIERLVGRLFDLSGSTLDARQREMVFEAMWPLLERNLTDLPAASQKKMPVDSATDLVDALAASLQPGRPPMTLDWDTLGRLQSELERLRGALDHLEGVEARMMPDRVPGGLTDTIASVDWRLQLTRSTVARALDRVYATLTPSQVSVLRRLVAPDGARVIRKFDDYPGQEEEALVQLSASGLVAANEDRTVVIHPLVAAELGGRFQAR